MKSILLSTMKILPDHFFYTDCRKGQDETRTCVTWGVWNTGSNKMLAQASQLNGEIPVKGKS